MSNEASTNTTHGTPVQPSRASPATDAGHRNQGALSAAIRVVSGLTLLSRFAGLARDIVTANIFGNTALSSAFRAAYAIPNLFRRLFGEGALSAAFLPEYTRLRRDQPDAAHQLASMIMRTDGQQGTFLNIVVGIIGAVLAGWLISPLIGVPTINQGDFSIAAMAVSLLGAVVLLGIVNLLRRGVAR